MTRLVALSHTGLHSGAERVLGRVLAAALADGWDVRCCVPDGPFADDLRAAGIPVVEVPDLKLPGGPRPLAALRLLGRARRASRILRAQGRTADVVLVNGLLGLPAARLARLRVPVVWLVHDIVRRRDWRALLRAVGPAVDLALPVSDAAAGPLVAAGIPVRVVRNGTAWPVDAAPHPAPLPPVIGCLGLLTPWKGQRVLLDAVAGLPADVRVELAGGTFPKDAPYAAELAERAERPDLRGRVELLGAVRDVHARLRGWTVVVSPSVEPDPAPLVVLEAMSVGVPVVATAHGGPPEYLGEAGLLVPPGDADALRDALRQLLDDADLRARCGAEGRRRVAELYRLDDRMAELLEAVRLAGRR